MNLKKLGFSKQGFGKEKLWTSNRGNVSPEEIAGLQNTHKFSVKDMNIVTDEINSRSYIKDSKTWLKEFNTVAEMHKVEEGYKTAGFSASAYKWLKPQINQFTGARTFRDYASASRPVESIKGARRATQGMAAILKKHNIKVPKGSTVDKEFSKRLEASNLFPSVGESDKLLAKRWSKNVDKWDARRSLLEKAKLK